MVELEEVEANPDFSDSDDGGEEHSRLLAAISKLDKRKRVQPSARREPSLQVSEFHLTKDGDSESNTVHLRDLAKALGQRAKHSDITRKLKLVQRKAKTLPKPLEKPEANRIQREVGYENVKKQLSEWDPVVFRNRVADDLVFPLGSANITTATPSDFLSTDQAATPLEKEIAEILNDSPSVEKERQEQEEFPLSLEEMIERRKELARVRAQQSYRMAKAHRQNKIKSKKYHRLARRDRIRLQLKEFEALQQKDPEAALQRLEELEKERVQERVTLRHRSTGQWARNQAVRAKYDKESRQVLAAQLRLSKELTQKINTESASSEDEAEITTEEPSDNPWVATQKKTETEVDDFISGYRKYWDEKNKSSIKEGQKSECKKNGEDNTKEKSGSKEDAETALKREALLASAVVAYEEITPSSSIAPKATPSESPRQKQKKSPSPIKKVSKKTKMETIRTASGKWLVSPNVDVGQDARSHQKVDIVELFEDAEVKLSKKAGDTLAKLKQNLESERKSKVHSKRGRIQDVESNKLEMKRQRLRPDVDEELIESTGTESNTLGNIFDDIERQEKVETGASDAIQSKQVNEKPVEPQLDPNKFIKATPTRLHTQVPDEMNGVDEGLDDSDNEEQSKHLTISEAFADDDVVAEFGKEKDEAVEKSKPEDINLTLPGWGDWGGHNINPNKKKRRRFIVKMPPPPPRRDENKGNLIINEKGETAVREHQVSSLPFPFTSVKDFEASVRAPISNTFIPESAHRKLIKPAVRTKMGAIITPMDKEVLVNRQKNRQKKHQKKHKN